MNNKLAEFPPEIFQLRSLQSLHLEMNTIRHIPPDIGTAQILLRANIGAGNLSILKKLILSNNLIQVIPRELTSLPKLRELRVSHNRISELPRGMIRNFFTCR